MKQRIVGFLKRCRFPVMTVFGTIPAPMAVIAYADAEYLTFFPLFPLAFLAALLPSVYQRGKRRLFFGIGGSLLQLVLGGVLIFRGASFFLLAVPVLYTVLLLCSLGSTAGLPGGETPAAWYWVGIASHLGIQVLMFVNRAEGVTVLEPISAWQLPCFFVFAAMALLALNDSCLNTSGNGQQHASVTMRRKNLLLTAGVFALALLVAYLPAAASALKYLLALALVAVMWLANVLAGGSETSVGNGETTSQAGLELWYDAVAKDHSHAVQIIGYIVIGILAVVLVFLIWWLSRRLRKLIAYLRKAMNRYLTNVTEDYVDEITDTREGVPEERGSLLRRLRPKRAVNERTLSPAARIRYRYLRLMLKHPEWTRGSTARETLPDDMAPIYERVRYDAHEATEEEAVRFIAGIKRV